MDSSKPCSSFRSIASLGFWLQVYAARLLPPRFLVAGFAISFSLPILWWDNGVAVAWFSAGRELKRCLVHPLRRGLLFCGRVFRR
jgi:hypothetical protein